MFSLFPVQETNSTTRQERGAGIYVVGVVAAILLLLSALLDTLPFAWADRCLFAGVGLLLLLLASSPEFRSGTLKRLRWGPNPFILLLLGWSLARTVPPIDFNLALSEVLRLIAGISAYFLVAYSAPLRRSHKAILLGVVGIGTVIALVNFTRLAEGGGIHGNFQFSVFATHEDAGSLMLLLCPLCIAVAMNGGVKEEWRLGAFVPTLILVTSLMVTRCRSAFAGAAAAALILGALQIYHTRRPKEERKRRRSSRDKSRFSASLLLERVFTSPLLLLLLGVTLFCLIFGTTLSYFTRTETTAKIVENIGTRLVMWRGAVLMLMEKPITGWGLGAYTGLEASWTHLGAELNAVHQFGSTHNNIAHNYYVQWAADTGIIGLCLHVAVIGAFLAVALQTLRRVRPLRETGQFALETALLTGIVAAVAGSSVDAFASPSYNYHGLSTIWWVLIGSGVGIAETISRSLDRSYPPESPSAAPVPGENPLFVWGVSISLAVFSAAAILGYGGWLREQGKERPRGSFRILTSNVQGTSGRTEPSWVAVYFNEQGQEEATWPGTQWRASGDQAAPTITYWQNTGIPTTNKKPSRSIVTLSRPSLSLKAGNASKIRVEAIYRDAYGRLYRTTNF